MEASKTNILRWLCMSLFLTAASVVYAQNDSINTIEPDYMGKDSTCINKVLFIGDSMTGWMAERLNAYGDINGFEVATVIWDGSTIQKWAKSSKLPDIIEETAPDAIFICLGMNELFEPNPDSKLKNYVETLKSDFGDTPFLWIGPPSFPGQAQGEILNNWLEKELGEKNYFSSFNLDLSRQSKSNPHPSRKGIEEWIDNVVEWIPDNSNLQFKSLNPPGKGILSRGKYFVYKRMKENL